MDETPIHRQMKADPTLTPGETGCWPCLDDGFVRYVDSMGDDAAIVQAARVSYGKGTKTVNDDRGLIRYLMRHWHTTPFEMCEVKVHVRAPIYVVRQWFRHRTGSPNEMSGRYSALPAEFHRPSVDEMRFQSVSNRQGSDGQIPDEVARAMIETLNQHAEMGFQVYDELRTGWPWFDEDGNQYVIPGATVPERKPHDRDNGLSREMARIHLPLSTYTEFYWKTDLHNLFHFLRLRADSHAQAQISVYAEAMLELAESLFPAACEAFIDYRMKAVNLSRMEAEIVRTIVAQFESQAAPNFLGDMAAIGGEMSKREIDELIEKMRIEQ